jgi:hypothetical protein
VTDSDQESSGILDTSTLILMARMSDTEALPSDPVITAITLAELSVGPLVATDEMERAARQAHIQQAEADFASRRNRLKPAGRGPGPPRDQGVAPSR